jgi:UDP:flavonoid glycosyltransferase YjiC (YdhE family)
MTSQDDGPRIAVLAGAAMGHVSRIFRVIESLADIMPIRPVFFSPQVGGVAEEIVSPRFPITMLPVAPGDWLAQSLEFAERLEAELHRSSFDFVVRDLFPLNWTLSLDCSPLPQINITNVYLTAIGGPSQYLEAHFQPLKAAANARRAAKGLAPLRSAFELYEADLVLLADPPPVCDLFPQTPPHHLAMDACYWNAPGELPPALDGVERPLIVSVGSTGRADIGADTVCHLARISRADAVVYVGRARSEGKVAEVFDFAFDRLPIEKLLPRAACVVTQGGAGSTYQALAAGKPVFVWPALPTHYVMANLIERLAAGLCLNTGFRISTMTTETIEYFAAGAEAVQARMGDGARKMAEEIARFWRSRRVP